MNNLSLCKINYKYR